MSELIAEVIARVEMTGIAVTKEDEFIKYV